MKENMDRPPVMDPKEALAYETAHPLNPAERTRPDLDVVMVEKQRMDLQRLLEAVEQK
ncbi:MAG TPA: hypothetical protein VHA30_03300 [Patescibacteria group bacterium]|nr:hypothetical protein [Patescibacteria group bacterium]